MSEVNGHRCLVSDPDPPRQCVSSRRRWRGRSILLLLFLAPGTPGPNETSTPT